MDFISRIISNAKNNTLVLFHTIEYGTKIYEKLKKEHPDKEFYYIDGEIKNKNRTKIGLGLVAFAPPDVDPFF